jgi:putative heme transporter
MSAHDNQAGADRLNATERMLSWWAILRLAAGIALGIGLVRFVWICGPALAVLVLSITIADAFGPVVRFGQRWMSRGLAVTLVYVTLLVIFGIGVYLMVPVIGSEFNQLAGQLPEMLGKFQGFVSHWTSRLGLGNQFHLADLVQQISGKLVSLPKTIATAALTAVLVVFLSFYWLLASPAIGGFLRSLLPESRRAECDRVTAHISRSMGGYLRGVAINAMATGGLVWVALHIAGINNAFALGALTACGEFFPYVGAILTSIPGILIAWLQSPSKALIALAIYVAVQQIEGHVLTPNIMRSQTDIPRPLVIISLFAGGAVGGLLGAIVAIPVAGAAKVLVEELVAPAIRRRWKRGEGE